MNPEKKRHEGATIGAIIVMLLLIVVAVTVSLNRGQIFSSRSSSANVTVASASFSSSSNSNAMVTNQAINKPVNQTATLSTVSQSSSSSSSSRSQNRTSLSKVSSQAVSSTSSTSSSSSSSSSSSVNSQANTTTITPVKTVWAGYIASNGRVATYVQASWVIPNVDCGPKGSGTSGVVFWVGLGGLFDPSVHRAGTLIVCSGGQSRYSLWYDSHPNDVGLIILLNRTATPGESVSASVSYSNATGEFTYSVQAGNQPTYNASETFPGQPPPVSAEWVVQSAPTFVGPMKMTDFGIVNFLQGSADIGDRMGNISSFEQGSDSHLFLSTFACTDSTIKASARPLNDTSAFAVVWESGGDC